MAAWLAALRNPSVTNQPPTEKELARMDWAVLVLVLFALFLGIGIANNAANASHEVNLGEGLPSLRVPSNWIIRVTPDKPQADVTADTVAGNATPGPQVPEGTIYAAMNPRSGSTFNSELSVMTRPVAATGTTGVTATAGNIVTARTALGAQRSRDLLRYRELSAEPVTVRGQEGILVTYAYVADPTRDQGAIAPPVVVQAQDLIFVSGDRIVIITMAADAADWDRQEQYFDIVTNSLRMRMVEVDVISDTLSATEEGR